MSAEKETAPAEERTVSAPAHQGNGRRPAGPVLTMERMDEVEPMPLRWLWPGVIPLGKLTMIVGDPGLGKSLITLDLAARVSRGLDWPDGTPNSPPSEVILLCAEDDPADTILPRLDAAEAMPIMINRVKAVPEGKRQRHFNLAADTAKLESVIVDDAQRADGGGTRLIIVDPLTEYLGSIDSHVTAEVRALLAPLTELAARKGIAIVAISHLNKSGGSAMYRTTGSLAFVAAARAVWAVGKDHEDEKRILMLPIKMNLAEDKGGFAYRIEAVNTPSRITAPRVIWEADRVQGDANELLQPPERKESRMSEARQAILNKLGEKGPLTAAEIARELGTKYNTTKITVRRMVEAGILVRDGEKVTLPALVACSPCSPVAREREQATGYKATGATTTTGEGEETFSPPPESTPKQAGASCFPLL
ncbi:MAG: AAA family ATPase [Spirochaetia bacterium]